MQKKIIALAIASAMTVPALAYAEATVSGQVNMSIDRVNDGNSPGTTNNKLTSNQSRLIVKGNEDLGSGMSAIAQLDTRFTADDGSTGTNTLFSGNTYLGLQGGFGTFRAGNIDTPFKSSTRNLDVFFDVAGDNRSSLGGLMGNGHDVRLPNSLIYTSPAMGGLTIAVGTVFGAETSTTTTTKGKDYSFALNYNQGPISAALAYDNATAGSGASGTMILTTTTGTANQFATTAFAPGPAGGDTNKALRIGGGYSVDAFTVNAIYEQITYNNAAGGVVGDYKNTNMYLAGKFNISSTDSVRLAYTNHGATKTPTVSVDDKATQIAVGYEHSMSKATSVYASYVKTTANAAYVQPIIITPTPGTGADPSVISFGMKHSF
jgi:predicted porin